MSGNKKIFLPSLLFRQIATKSCDVTFVQQIFPQGTKQEGWANAHETCETQQQFLFAGCLVIVAIHYSAAKNCKKSLEATTSGFKVINVDTTK